MLNTYTAIFVLENCDFVFFAAMIWCDLAFNTDGCFAVSFDIR